MFTALQVRRVLFIEAYNSRWVTSQLMQYDTGKL